MSPAGAREHTPVTDIGGGTQIAWVEDADGNVIRFQTTVPASHAGGSAFDRARTDGPAAHWSHEREGAHVLFEAERERPIAVRPRRCRVRRRSRRGCARTSRRLT